MAAANDHLSHRHFNLVRVLVRDSWQLRGFPGKENEFGIFYEVLSRVFVRARERFQWVAFFFSPICALGFWMLCVVFLLVGAVEFDRFITAVTVSCRSTFVMVETFERFLCFGRRVAAGRCETSSSRRPIHAI